MKVVLLADAFATLPGPDTDQLEKAYPEGAAFAAIETTEPAVSPEALPLPL